MTVGTTYVIKRHWKTNKPAARATIFAEAAPSVSSSPTSLTVQLVPA